MKSVLSKISSSLVGVAFGVLANYSILLGSWLNLLIWAFVGISIGFFIEERRFVTGAGICYGFFVTIAFLISGFHGTSANIQGFAVLCAVLGIVGALCGWILVSVSNWIKIKLFRSR